MSDELNEGNEQGNSGDDSAAIAAAAGFWEANPELEAKAEREVPAEPSMSPARHAALKQEHDDQRLELEEAGELDPEQPDGIPAPKQNTPAKTKQALSGKPAAAAKGSETPSETGLDPILRSIAEDSGWTQEDIDELYDTNPDVATRTFERLADKYANDSRQYLNAPASTQPAAATQTTPATVQSVQPAAQLPPELSDAALQKFAETEGEASANVLKVLRDHFVARDNARDKAVDERLGKFESTAKAAETRAVAQEASGTLATLTEKFPALYGTGDEPKTLLLVQYQKRVELASLADQIRSGAMAQGRTVSVKDAILRAHYIVSRDSVKAEARKEITKQVKQRAKNATIRPTQRQNPATTGETRSDNAAIAAATEKMAEIGLNDLD